ncbi:MAG: MFS transporter [Clostridia bacterium]|nr:MFS transporter [Clostridia bacterium]
MSGSTAPAATAEQESFLTPGYLAVALTNFLQHLSLYVALPVLPLFVQSMGGSEVEVGWVGTAFFVATLATHPMAGRLADRAGRSRPLMLGGAVTLATLLAYPLAGHAWVLTAMRVVHGVAYAFFTTAATAIVADMVPQSRRGEALGIYGMSANVAAAFGPAAGLFLVKPLGFGLTFAVAALMGLVCLAFATWLARTPAAQKSGAQNAGVAVGGPEPAVTGRLLVPFVVLATYGFSYAVHVNFIPILAEERGIEGAGFYFTVYACAIIAARSFTGRVGDRFGRTWMIVPGALVAAAGTALLSGVASLPRLLLTAVVYGLGSGSIHPGVLAQMVDLVPPHRRGTATAAFYASFQTGIAIGGPVIGWLVQEVGLRSALLATAAVCVCGAAIHFLGPWREDVTLR